MAFTQGSYNINVFRGDTYTFDGQLNYVDNNTGQRRPIDLTGYDIKGQVRRTADSNTVWFDLSDYRLAITDAAQGKFGFKILSGESEALHPAGSIESNSGVYDIEFSKNVGNENGEVVVTYFGGTITILDDVTRAESTPREEIGLSDLSSMIKRGR